MVSAGPGSGLCRRAGVSLPAPQRDPSALPRSPHGSEAGGDPGAVRTEGPVREPGMLWRSRVGGEAAARRVRKEPLPSHPAGERLCSSRAPGRVG